MNRYGVIDLGTNTFHLLIVEHRHGAGFRELYRERLFTKLAAEGIETIGAGPFEGGLEAIRHFHTILQQHHVEAVKAFGTAALRTASNGPDFIRRVREQTGIRVELISGEREALLIHRGVSMALPSGPHNRLIMDIGGGSVEFIIADENRVHWARSFPVGLAVLYHQFHRHDPITAEETGLIRSFLDERLAPLAEALSLYPAPELVGASGAFDVLEDMLAPEKTAPHHSMMPLGAFQNLYRAMLPTTHAQRLQTPKLPADRADMFIVALELIDFVLAKTGIQQALISNFAMKEGMLYELIDERSGSSTHD